MRRPTVLFVDHCARLSGGEIALLRLVPDLSASVEVVVALGEDGPLVAELESAGARVVVLPMDGALRDRRKDTGARGRDVWRALTYAWTLRALVRRTRADLVHTNSLKAALYGGLAGRLAGVPVVWHVRDRIATDYLPRPAVVLVRALGLLLPTAVLVNSRATRATLWRAGRAVVVPDSVPPVERRVRPDVDGPLVFGVVGRLSEWKGQHVFLRAFAAQFAGTQHRARLVGSAMFGEQEYEQHLVALVGELGIADQVELRGFRRDVADEYEQLDVLVHCSTVPEPFGQVVVEGQAHGLAVIASAAGGPAEVVTPDVDGLLTAPGDEAALGTAMRRLADDPPLRRRLGDAAVVNACRYSGAATAAAVLGAYSRVLRRTL